MKISCNELLLFFGLLCILSQLREKGNPESRGRSYSERSHMRTSLNTEKKRLL
jgi:hypothetical protein